MRWRLTVLAALVATACREPVGRGWDWNRMREQPRTVAYGAAAALPGGMVLQPPPDGAVAREDSDITMISPALSRGRDRYGIFCAVCHGIHGDGQGLMARNIPPPLPPSLVSGAAGSLPDSRLDSVITLGYGTMMGFGVDLPRADRAAVIAYIHRLRTGVP